MKKVFSTLLVVLSSLSLYSQAPEGFNYHSIVRNNSGDPIVSQAVSFRFSILKGSPLGEIVYEERHDVLTDQIGAVSLVIGEGTNKSGNFETIDWGAGSYFLKIELDPAGGSLFIEMGTAQLMSVPYSLYSKTAANVFSGNYNDLTNKPITDGSETNINAGDNMIITGTGTMADPYKITNGFSGNFDDLTNTPITDGSETKISAGNFIAIEGTGTISNPYKISNLLSGDYNDLINKPVTNGSETKIAVGNNLTISGSGTINDPYVLSTRVHTVGEFYGGGIVFYVYDNGQHGLIAAATDQNPGIEWYNGTKRYTNTTGDGILAGEMNTILITALQTNDNPTGNFAAKVCADYSVISEAITYGDWYLPSKFELGLLFSQKNLVGGFKDNYYWSSTEFSSVSAWSQNFSTGIQYNLSKSLPYSVRAIRSF
jgi:hypothetical protein